MTVGATLVGNFCITDMAKFLPLDDVVVGVKLVYAGGASRIERGKVKTTKKNRDFLNQVTFWFASGVSCKVFKNGNVHLTGVKSTRQAHEELDQLISRLNTLEGTEPLSLDSCGVDPADKLLYTPSGDVLGFHIGEDKYSLETTLVQRDLAFTDLVFKKHTKFVYDWNGDVIGKRELVLQPNCPKRFTSLQFGYVYANKEIVGKEVITDLVPQKYEVPLFHRYKVSLTKNDTLSVYLVNSHFQFGKSISRQKLNDFLLSNEYDSRFDIASSPSVKLYLTGSTVRFFASGKVILSSTSETAPKEAYVLLFSLLQRASL